MEPDPQPYWMKMAYKVPSEDWTGQKVDVTTADDEMGQFKQFILALKAVATVLVVVLMIVVVIGILNTLAIAIRERTREIGTLRAIGMQRGKVLWLFVLETALLGLSGTVAGALARVGRRRARQRGGHPAPRGGAGLPRAGEAPLPAAAGRPSLADVLLLPSITVLASLYPAWLAAKLKPITAMHQIG